MLLRMGRTTGINAKYEKSLFLDLKPQRKTCQSPGLWCAPLISPKALWGGTSESGQGPVQRGQHGCQNVILSLSVFSPPLLSSLPVSWFDLPVYLSSIMPIALLPCLPAFLASLEPVPLVTSTYAPIMALPEAPSASNDTLLHYWQV